MSNLANEKDILNQENIFQEEQHDNINDENLQKCHPFHDKKRQEQSIF